MKKRLVLLLCMIACVFSLVACSSEKRQTKTFKYDKEAEQEAIEETVKMISGLSKKDAEKAMENCEEGSYEYTLLEAWVRSVDELGEFVAIKKTVFDDEEKSFICRVGVEYEKRDAEFTFIVSKEEVTASLTVQYTFAEKMKQAGLNTLLGLSAVFFVLILIAWLISLFKYINKFEQKLKNKESKATESTANVAVENTIAQIVEKEESVTDDLELVAVITAAIASMEGTSTDGLVVRSIKRVNKSKWQRA